MEIDNHCLLELSHRKTEKEAKITKYFYNSFNQRSNTEFHAERNVFHLLHINRSLQIKTYFFCNLILGFAKNAVKTHSWSRKCRISVQFQWGWLIMERSKGELNNCIDNYNWQASIQHTHRNRLVSSNDITKANGTRELWTNEVGWLVLCLCICCLIGKAHTSMGSSI